MTDYVRAASVFVNLGKLFSTTRLTKKRPTSWAYFDDGSIFIVPYTYLDHDAFELRMKVIAPFISAPTLRMQANRQSDALKKRLVVINNDRSTSLGPVLRLVARKVHNGEHITTAEIPFEHITVSFDETTHEYIHSTITGGSNLTLKQNSAVEKALRTFRGTYVDGTLQPNVRLGNGLELLDMPAAMEARSVKQANEKRAMLQSSSKPAVFQHQSASRELELKEALLEARARELNAREEGLLWKQKAFELQQMMQNKENGGAGPDAQKYKLPRKHDAMIRRGPGNAPADRTPTSAASRSTNTDDRFGSGSPNDMTASYSPSTASQLDNPVAYSPALATRQASAQFVAESTHNYIPANRTQNVISSSDSRGPQFDSFPSSDLDTTPSTYSPTPTSRQASAQSPAETTDDSASSNEPQNLNPDPSPRRPLSGMFPSFNFDTSPPAELVNLRARRRKPT
ncbi:hypothetical protein HBI70_124770 [Parastagonospora nodorum]|nr:hypothetical protein HBH53_094660 [Parastagonospora nodorum]KAH5269159.1 hypothetical protein HBI70_124770 [Parastagonospora nodorum]KAH5280158.1 hypothetical protein HBI72_016340 [Parastagonospora nodorum]KAH5329409.1 hypothetical protein HBI11_019950 [Parastagonospora nodorum]KAH5529750.1 hypothetical protein HBI29_020350 [Parastagonospora nodorum]